MQVKEEQRFQEQVIVPIFCIQEHADTGEILREKWYATHDSPSFLNGKVVDIKNVKLPEGWRIGADREHLQCIVDAEDREIELLQKDGIIYAQVIEDDKEHEHQRQLYELEFA